MSFNYPLADLVSRLNVSSKKRVLRVSVFYNDLSLRVLDVLHANGVISSYSVKGAEVRRISVVLKYSSVGPAFRRISVVSRPGCRIYWSLKGLGSSYNFSNFSGFYILSTPVGLITSNDSLLGQAAAGEVLLAVSI